jgi:hypothetical protein
MQLKITRDFANGGRHQVKYFQDRPGYHRAWFDYGEPFHSRKRAEEFVNALITPPVKEKSNERET